MNRILCLDLGTTTGFAFHSEGDVSHGIKKFPKDLGERLHEFYDWLHTLRPDRLKALGNGQVPSQLVLAWSVLGGASNAEGPPER